jgi:uncharacterized membrane protein YidH (DUF202 family)
MAMSTTGKNQEEAGFNMMTKTALIVILIVTIPLFLILYMYLRYKRTASKIKLPKMRKSEPKAASTDIQE